MKKKYTKKQITEAIAYWKKQLKKMNEGFNESCGYEHKVGNDIAVDLPNGSFLTGVVTKVYKDQQGKVGGYEIDVDGKKYKVDCEWVVG